MSLLLSSIESALSPSLFVGVIYWVFLSVSLSGIESDFDIYGIDSFSISCPSNILIPG